MAEKTMKYHAIIMAPQLVTFDNDGKLLTSVNHEAHTFCSNFPDVHIKMGDAVHQYTPKLLLVVPAKSDPESPLVFDPPPMVA